MLDAPELKRRLVAAMDKATPKVTSAAVAKACGVTAQAVNGWRKTGRYDKRHIPKIAGLTGKPLEYFLGDEAGDVTVNYGLVLKREEAEAMKRLQDALPEWRKYVLNLAMVNKTTQQVLLAAMGAPASNEAVRAAYGDAPHVQQAKTEK